MKHVVICVLVLLSVSGASAARAADFYVRPAGNDASDGRSWSGAWATIGRANGQAMRPGDTLNLEGGATFDGTIVPDGCGASGLPIVVQSFGTGQATVRAGTGVWIHNCGFITIRNLTFTGGGVDGAGIQIYGDQPATRYPDVTIEDVNVSGFQNGLNLGTWSGTSGFDNLRIARVAAWGNVRAGIVIWGQSRGAHRNVSIVEAEAYRNLGDPSMTTNSGSGIVLGQVDGAVVERSTAYENGPLCMAHQCGAGIWTYDSNAVTFRNNVSHHNRTGSNVDGDGFDFDGGVTNSVMEGNLSHDNDGAGYLLCQYPGVGPHTGNVLRGNESRRDGAKTGFGAIHFYGDVGSAEIVGNIIADAPLMIDGYGGRPAVRLDGNVYLGAFRVRWNGAVHGSLEGFRAATGNETRSTPAPPPPGTCPAAIPVGAFQGCYYHGRALDAFVASRIDTAIAFAWGDGGPAAGVQADDFSVRWRGEFPFAAAEYEFSVRSDDGVRMFVDGILVLDQWVDRGPTTNVFRRTLSGHHVLTVEYYEHGGGADASVFWTKIAAAPTTRTEAPTAAFVGADVTTRGNWNGAYGAAGYSLAPGPGAAGASTWVWAGETADNRALQQPEGARVAACWYSPTVLTLQSDGGPRRLAVYVVDFDGWGRRFRVEAVDPATGAVLDAREVNDYREGMYLSWQVTGHVLLRFTNTGPENVVVSGGFVDAAGGL